MRAPWVSESTTYSQKSRSGWHLDRVVAAAPAGWTASPLPARSWLVKIRPTRPRAAWLWLVWRARVDLPESMVPVKNCSSATGGILPRAAGQRPGPGSASPPRSATRACRPASPRTGSADVSSPRSRPRQATITSPSRGPHLGPSTGAEPAAGERLVPGQHLGPVAEHVRQAASDVVDRAAAAVEVPEPRLAAEQGDAVAQLRVLVDVDAGRPSGESTIPWSATTTIRRSSGSASRSCSAAASIMRQLLLATAADATPYRWPVQSRSPSYM